MSDVIGKKMILTNGRRDCVVAPNKGFCRMFEPAVKNKVEFWLGGDFGFEGMA